MSISKGTSRQLKKKSTHLSNITLFVQHLCHKRHSVFLLYLSPLVVFLNPWDSEEFKGSHRQLRVEYANAAAVRQGSCRITLL